MLILALCMDVLYVDDMTEVAAQSALRNIEGLGRLAEGLGLGEDYAYIGKAALAAQDLIMWAGSPELFVPPETIDELTGQTQIPFRYMHRLSDDGTAREWLEFASTDVDPDTSIVGSTGKPKALRVMEEYETGDWVGSPLTYSRLALEIETVSGLRVVNSATSLWWLIMKGNASDKPAAYGALQSLRKRGGVSCVEELSLWARGIWGGRATNHSP